MFKAIICIFLSSHYHFFVSVEHCTLNIIGNKIPFHQSLRYPTLRAASGQRSHSVHFSFKINIAIQQQGNQGSPQDLVSTVQFCIQLQVVHVLGVFQNATCNMAATPSYNPVSQCCVYAVHNLSLYYIWKVALNTEQYSLG